MASGKKNILWIMSDQHNASCLGMERPDVRTPNLDRLAAGGTRFTEAFCNNPICGPSRCSMITGQYPHTTGITGNEIHGLDNAAAPVPRTLPVVLREASYETMMVGKAHMIRAWNEAGFEHRRYCDLADSNDGDPRSVAYFQHLIDHGLADAYDLGSRFPGQTGNELERFISEIPLEHHLETWTGNQAVQLLQSRDRARPFMMQMSFQRPHEPLCIPPECADWYDPASLTLPDNISDFFQRGFEGKPGFQQEYVRGGVKGYPYRPRDEADLRGQLAYYYTLITLIDQQVGRVLDELRAQGELDNTVICYVADHGDFAGEHGLILKNLGIYESIHRVPFILSYPGGPRGVVRQGLVELVDLYPTLLDAAGLSTLVPEEVEGTSRTPLARGEGGGREFVVAEYDFNKRQPYSVAVRTPAHRLVLYPWQDDEIGELYDRQADPGELNNLWDHPDHAAMRFALVQRALSFVSHYRRRWSTRDDGRNRGEPNARVMLQQRGFKWSSTEVQGKLPQKLPR